MGLSYEEDNSRSERIKRAIRNPTKRTFLIVLVLLLVVASPFMASIFNNAREGIGSATAEHDLDINMNLGPGELEDEEIAPWLSSQIDIMANATGPLEWEIGNYRFGPCSPERNGTIADASYRAALAEGCDQLYDIQGKYQRDCYLATTCNVIETTKQELAAVANLVRIAHSDAGYVWQNP